jgi:hypothetical protein
MRRPRRDLRSNPAGTHVDALDVVARRPVPARRPKTIRSHSELPPRRLEPCMPPATSPAAKRPGTQVAAVSGVDLERRP